MSTEVTIIVATYPGDKHLPIISEYLQKVYPEVHVIYQGAKIKGSFSENNNAAAKLAKTQYILFLNSDTEIHPGSIEAMAKILKSNSSFGIVGAKLYFLQNIFNSIKFQGNKISISGVKNRVQHAGIRFNEALLPYEFGWNAALDNVEVNKRTASGAVTGACMMVRRDEFLEMGGFDETYINGWEDADLCLRYIEKDKLTMYEPEALVGHFYGAATGRYKHEDTNFEYWYKKWHDSGRIYKIFFPQIPQGVEKLDVGCGGNKKNGYFGVDKNEGESVDFVFNLETMSHINNIRMPFASSSMKSIYCAHTLEHTENIIEVMNEFHRLLKVDGWLELIVPHMQSWSAWASPFHKRFFVPEMFTEYFASGKREEKLSTEKDMDLIKPWHIEKCDYTLVPQGVDPFMIQREIKVVARPLK